MKKIVYILLVLFSFGSFNSLSQIEQINGGPVNVPTEGIIDGVFIQEHIPTKRMIPYEHVREADVLWSRRVFQYIDLREKINQELYFPMDDVSSTGVWTENATRLSLWSIIRRHVMNGDLRVFSPYNPDNKYGDWDGYQLKYPLDPQPGLNYDSDTNFRDAMIYYLGEVFESNIEITDEYGDVVYFIDESGNEVAMTEAPDTTWYTSKDIVQYRIKEDWFFDKERSVLDVRILAIAPVVYNKEEDGAVSGMRELFWLYFPHCRFVFNNYFVYNDKNDAQWMSFDDLFWKRKFNSVIYKQSNTYDRKIESYRAGIDALYESEKIKDEIRNIEHDVWSF